MWSEHICEVKCGSSCARLDPRSSFIWIFGTPKYNYQNTLLILRGKLLFFRCCVQELKINEGIMIKIKTKRKNSEREIPSACILAVFCLSKSFLGAYFEVKTSFQIHGRVHLQRSGDKHTPSATSNRLWGTAPLKVCDSGTFGEHLLFCRDLQWAVLSPSDPL